MNGIYTVGVVDTYTPYFTFWRRLRVCPYSHCEFYTVPFFDDNLSFLVTNVNVASTAINCHVVSFVVCVRNVAGVCFACRKK